MTNKEIERWESIRDKIDIIIGSYEFEQLELTAWEIDFFDSISMQFSNTDNLSDKQISILNKIISRIG